MKETINYLKKFFNCSYQAIVMTIEHDGVEHAGYMSFIMMLSIFPFFVFLIALTSFLGASELGTKFIHFLLENMPAYSIDAIKTRINELNTAPPQSLVTLAIAGSIWTASSFVECLRTILNRVYRITNPPKYIWRRLLSIVQFIFLSLLLSFAMFILIIVPNLLMQLPAVASYVQDYTTILNSTRLLLIVFSLFLTTSALYLIVPNTKINFKETVPGSLLSILLWLVSGYLLSEYIIYYRQLNIVYGSIGGMIVTMIFFYIVNFILIYGAEFNYLYSRNKA